MLNFMKIQVNYWLGASYYRLVSGEFLKKNLFFFRLNLVSAQRLSALFPLRRFCSVANLNLKYLSLHICLESLFNKAGIRKV